MTRFASTSIILSLALALVLCTCINSSTAFISSISNSGSPSSNTFNNNNTDNPHQHHSTSNNANMNDNEPNNTNNNEPNNKNDKSLIQAQAGKIEELKQREAALSRLLAAVRLEKLAALRSRPLTIGIVGFGRFGQFMARTFVKHGRVVVTSRSDYTDVANGMGVTYVPLSSPASFLNENLDVIVLATSIVSFEGTVQKLAPHLQSYIDRSGQDRGPLIVDVLSVKEHPRQILLDLLPRQCDILCTHPMFGPDSGKNGWHGLNFVYERTRIDGVVLDPSHERSFHQLSRAESLDENDDVHSSFVEQGSGAVHSLHENSEAHVEGMDRMERFLSVWEEEGCRMVQLSCADHDAYAANSQFITHLMGRILGAQGLRPTPIDTRGFESVLKLVGSTTADSFDLFYGLYKYNQNSLDTIMKLKESMDDVVEKLKEMEENDTNAAPTCMKRGNSLLNMQQSFGMWLQSEDEKKEEECKRLLAAGESDRVLV